MQYQLKTVKPVVRRPVRVLNMGKSVFFVSHIVGVGSLVSELDRGGVLACDYIGR